MPFGIEKLFIPIIKLRILAVLFFSLICGTVRADGVWTAETAPVGTPGVDTVSSIFVDKADPTKFYAVVSGALKRYNSGSWSAFPRVIAPNGIPGAVLGAYANGGVIIAGADANPPGTYHSTNAGADWIQESTPIITSQMSAITQGSSGYIGLDNYGIVSSGDGGSWVREYTASFCLAPRLIYPLGNSLFANCGGTLRSDDGGHSWTTLSGIGAADALSGSGSVLYANYALVIYKTVNKGQSWTPVQPLFGQGDPGAAVFLNGVLISYFNGKLYQTSDDGNTWTPLPAIDPINNSIKQRNLYMASGSKLYVLGTDYKIYSIPVAPVSLVKAGDPVTSGSSSGCGMCVARASLMAVSLNLNDTPVGYQPAVGPSAYVTISYNQKEAGLPATPNFSNLGPKWTHNFINYIEDAAAYPGQSVRRIVGGGGAVAYDSSTYDTGTGAFSPELQSQGVLKRTPTTGVATSYTFTLPDGTVYLYNVAGSGSPHRLFLTSITDPQGQQLTLNYASQKLTSITDATGRSTTFSYTNSNPLLLTRITDPFGRHADLNYDTSGRLQSIQDVQGITSSFAYPTTVTTDKLFAFVSSMTTPYGTSTFSYGEDVGNNYYWLEMTDPLGQTERVEAVDNASDSTTTAPVKPSGLVLPANTTYAKNNTYYWDKYAYQQGITKSGGVITAKDYTKAALYHWLKSTDGTKSPIVGAFRPAVQNAGTMVDRFTFFNYANQPADGDTVGTTGSPTLIGRVAEDGTTPQVYTVAYNAKGFPYNIKDPLLRETLLSYKVNGFDLDTIQQKTSSSGYSQIGKLDNYNTQHLPGTYIDAAGQSWLAGYNGIGQLTNVTNPLGQLVQFSYDTSTHKRLLNVSRSYGMGLSNVLSLAYDGYDRVRTATDNRYLDSQYYSLTYDYDALDHITKVTYPDATTESYSYSFPAGWPNQGCIQCPVPGVVVPSLDVWKVTDRMGRTADLNYDRTRRLTSVTETVTVNGAAVPRTTSYEYYPNGALMNLVDANGTITHWDIDVQGRVTGKVYDYCRIPAVPTCRPTSSKETYTYDVLGRLKTVTDALNQVKTYSYNLDNSIAGVSYSIPAGLPPMANVSFGYDPWFPRPTSMMDGFGTTVWSYKAVGTNGALGPDTEDGPFANDTLAYSYDAAGRVTARQIGDATDSVVYDDLGRVQSHYVQDIATFSYTYLGLTDQATSRTVTNGLGLGLTLTTSYGYDTNVNDRRLLSITNTGSAARSYGYTTNPYQIAGITETAFAGASWPAQTRSYGYDAADRLLSAYGSTAGATSYGYDKLDNATSIVTAGVTNNPSYNALNQIMAFNGQAYSYDANGNLTNDGARTYKYNAEGLLVEIGYAGSTAKSAFGYDGLGRRLSQTETPASGSAVTTRAMWCGATLCQERSSTNVVTRRYYPGEGERRPAAYESYAHMTDHLGSVREMVGTGSGTTKFAHDYDAYGKSERDWTNSSSPATNLRYAELMLHPNSGLYLSATRAYSPTTGHWLHRDLIGEAGGVNLYGYTESNPINLIDPDGLIGQPLGFKPDPYAMRDAMTDLLVGGGNFTAGLTDKVTFNLSDRFRRANDINVFVDYNSAAYRVGCWSGIVVDLWGGKIALRAVFGPLKQWVRIGNSYSRLLKTETVGLRWGASPMYNGKFLNEIPFQKMRELNQWLRSLKLPFGGWRSGDPGHFHFWER